MKLAKGYLCMNRLPLCMCFRPGIHFIPKSTTQVSLLVSCLHEESLHGKNTLVGYTSWGCAMTSVGEKIEPVGEEYILVVYIYTLLLYTGRYCTKTSQVGSIS